MFRQGLHRKHDLTGLFSPKFRKKSRKTGAEFISLVNEHPGADVYMINPYPHHGI